MPNYHPYLVCNYSNFTFIARA